MFYNDAVEFFNATEADGAAIEQRVDSEFSNFVSIFLVHYRMALTVIVS